MSCNAGPSRPSRASPPSSIQCVRSYGTSIRTERTETAERRLDGTAEAAAPGVVAPGVVAPEAAAPGAAAEVAPRSGHETSTPPCRGHTCTPESAQVWGLNLPGWDARLPAPPIPRAIGAAAFDAMRSTANIDELLQRTYVSSEALGETTGMYLKVCAAAAALATAWPY